MKTLRVSVRPNARHESLEQAPDQSWRACVKAAPVDGKANAALIALLASHFGIPKSRFSVKRGARARVKIIQIEE